jgi:small subunit ribosomal protein S6
LREYETVFILHPGLEDQQIEEEIEGVRKTIEAGSGEIVSVERWGRRKLAYEIRKVHEGIYTLIRFRSDVGVFQELERRYRLRENVLRHLTVVAQGPPPEPPAPKDETSEGAKAARDSVPEATIGAEKPADGPKPEKAAEPAAEQQASGDRPELPETEEVKETVASDDKLSGMTPETKSTLEEPEGSAKNPPAPEADSQTS